MLNGFQGLADKILPDRQYGALAAGLKGSQGFCSGAKLGSCGLWCFLDQLDVVVKLMETLIHGLHH